MIATNKRVKDLIKQRLVGALILLALGVVFWPIIFTPPTGPDAVERVAVPAEPVMDTKILPRPNAAGLRVPKAVLQPEDILSEEELALLAADDVAASKPVKSTTPKPVKSTVPKPVKAKPHKPKTERPVRERAPTKPETDAQGLPLAWMLQVVSVSDAKKAKALRGELLGMGHKAYIKQVPVDGKTLYRIYIGPKFEKAALQRLKPEIDARFGVNSLVKRYLP